jgi:hypothetical protein
MQTTISVDRHEDERRAHAAAIAMFRQQDEPRQAAPVERQPRDDAPDTERLKVLFRKR